MRKKLIILHITNIILWVVVITLQAIFDFGDFKEVLIILMAILTVINLVFIILQIKKLS
jgi:hypothetical protein